MVDTKEILRKVRRIEIVTNRLVNDVMAGEYHSVFKGRGIEFDEIRNYVHGDDVRTIDWNVTARTGFPHVKRYVEERELTVVLAVDVSGSTLFGSRQELKVELQAELAALFAFAAIKNNDRVGLLLFTEQIEKFVPPKKGRRHVLRVIRELLGYEPQRHGTDLNVALEYLNKVLSRRCIIFLISDFIAGDFRQLLAVTNKHHDLIALVVIDPREMELPPAGLLRLEDAETGEIVTIDTSDAKVRQEFARAAQKEREEIFELFRSLGLDFIKVVIGEDYIKPLIRLFRKRASRF
ncbi:DUF58 domain-containing protein [Candidatus Sumerlaeota bacterium]|nr:DUF58 domain-containing protein [Candidatus Sumerlaeota bacterium]